MTIDLALQAMRSAAKGVEQALEMLGADTENVSGTQLAFWLGYGIGDLLSTATRLCRDVSKLTRRDIRLNLPHNRMQSDPHDYLREAHERLLETTERLHAEFLSACQTAVENFGDEGLLSDDDLQRLLGG
jgi:hypothetical protein